MKGLWEILSSAIKPITDLIDNLTTTDEERLELKNKLVELQNNLAMKILEYQSRLTEAQSRVIIAEAQGESWLQRNWRPILMLTVIAIIANNYILFHFMQLFGINVPVLNLPKELYILMTVGVGGYVAGRSGEKMIRNYRRDLNGKQDSSSSE